MYQRLYKWSLQVIIYLFILCCPAYADAQRPTYIDSLLNKLNHARSDTDKANTLIKLAFAYRHGAVAKEFYYANEALTLSEKAGFAKGIMHGHQLIGDCYSKVTAHNNAKGHFRAAITEARKLNRTDVQAFCYQLLVYAYHETNDMEHAILVQKEYYDFTLRINDTLNQYRQLSAYGLCLSDAGHYKQAITYLKQDVSFAERNFTGTQRTDLLSNILNTLATTYVKTNTDSALHYIRIAQDLANQIPNYSGTAYIISTLCDIYTERKQYDSAIIYGERTIKLGEAINDTGLLQCYYRVISQVYEGADRPTMALMYHKLHDSMVNVILDSRKTIDEAMQVTRTNIEQQAERNKIEQTASDAIRRNQQAALVAALTAVAALIALTIFIYRSLRQKQKANRTISMQAASLQQQNELIDKALKEKEVLLKETHHRVKNNLQLISSLLELQAANLEDENAKDALRSAQRRVLSIATVHSKLYGSDDDETIDFSSFAADLFARLHSAFSIDGLNIKFTNGIPVTFLPLNSVVLLGIILNELITNSFKHALPGNATPAVSIFLEVTGNKYALRYHDNGPGLQDGIFTADTGSLGLYLVRRLSKQLKGSASYNFEAGSTFTITFPNAAG